MRTHATNCVGKMSLKNCQILENVLEILRFPSRILRFPSPKIQFFSPKIQFSSHEIRFSPIVLLLSSTAFCFLQWLSTFFNGFPLSSTAFWLSSTAFWLSSRAFQLSKKSKKIYSRQQVYKRSLFELCIVCHLLLELRNFRYNTQHALGCVPMGSLCFAQCNSAGLPSYEIFCSGFLIIPLPIGMHLEVSPEEHHIFNLLSSLTA